MLAFERDLRVQGEAGGHAHRQPQQFAHEMILQIREDHLEVVQMRLGADKTGHVIDHERIVSPRQAVAQRLGRRHVDTVVLSVADFTALSGLEVHALLRDLAQRAAAAHGSVTFVEQLDGHVEFAG